MFRFIEDGGNSIEDEWPGEPADAFWRQQLDSAEEELRQVLFYSTHRILLKCPK